jgi:spore germination cell wall hydrolase CwlJ-like protein
MNVPRHRPNGGFRAPSGLCVVAGCLAAGLAPTMIGHQDLAALIAQRPMIAPQPMVVEHWHSHNIASPFGTIEAATFSMPMPISEAMPVSLSYALAGLDPGNADITGSIRERMLGDVAIEALQESSLSSSLGSPLPQVNRRLKGDRLALGAPPEEVSAPVAEQSPEPLKKGDRLVAVQSPEPPSAMADEEQPTEGPTGEALPPFSVARLDYGASDDSTGDPTGYWPDLPARRPGSGASAQPEAEPHPDPIIVPEDADAGVPVARLYFGIDPVGSFGVIQPWMPGEAPQLNDRRAAVEPDFKTAALTPETAGPDKAPYAKDESARGGETIAHKGQVTGADQHPMSPAERLRLDDKGRAKAVKCLTEAIYFEARGESVRGQIAVAQVVMNRVFSGYYPGTVCGVVFQNANRHLACQFTFACDGIPEVVREPEAWDRAKKIAAETLDGQLWLPEVGKATHYHAYWVRPSWVHEMTRMYKLGVHTFYRPKRWGDGADAPEWGDAATTAAAAKNL